MSEFDLDAEPTFIGQEQPDDAPRERKQRSDKGKARGPRGAKTRAKLGEIEEHLAQTIAELSIPISFIAPTGAAFWSMRADRNARLIIRIAERNPRLLKMLEKGDAYAMYVELGAFMAGFGLAVAVDMGRASPETMAAQTLGVAEAFATAHPESEENDAHERSVDQYTPSLLDRTAAGTG